MHEVAHSLQAWGAPPSHLSSTRTAEIKYHPCGKQGQSLTNKLHWQLNTLQELSFKTWTRPLRSHEGQQKDARDFLLLSERFSGSLPVFLGGGRGCSHS